MTKQRKIARDAKTGRYVGGYQVLGKTRDGVRILKPKGKPKSFSVVKLKKAIASANVKAEKAV